MIEALEDLPPFSNTMTDTPPICADSQRVLSALTGLHRAYPLERRLQKEACETTRETYLAVLLRWTQTGVAPSVDGFDLESLDELTALDAIQIVNGLISCPPFSATPTNIVVHCPHETMYAVSALDALALPRLLNTAATIETRCALNGEPINVSVTEKGEIPLVQLDGVLIAFQKISNNISRYSFDLAPGISFVLSKYASALQQSLSLAESAAVANAFYDFQRNLIKADPR